MSVLLKELQCLVEAAYDSIITANLSAIEVPDNRTADSKMNYESQLMEVEATVLPLFTQCSKEETMLTAL